MIKLRGYYGRMVTARNEDLITNDCVSGKLNNISVFHDAGGMQILLNIGK